MSLLWVSAQDALEIGGWRLAIFRTTDGIRSLVDVLTVAYEDAVEWVGLDAALAAAGYWRAAPWENGSHSGYVARLAEGEDLALDELVRELAGSV